MRRSCRCQLPPVGLPRLAASREVLEHLLDAAGAQQGEALGGDRFAEGAERVTVGGLVTAAKVIPIKREGKNQGRRMAVFQLEDPSGTVRVVVFPDAFETCQQLKADESTRDVAFPYLVGWEGA